jgi:CheY-like chemotaxis protein
VDIGLPGGMDGWEVARRLKEQAPGKNPLLIAMTGYGMEADVRRSADAGIHLHLLKPADPEALHQLLERVRATLGK